MTPTSQVRKHSPSLAKEIAGSDINPVRDTHRLNTSLPGTLLKKEGRKKLLFGRQNDLLALGSLRHAALFAVFSNIVNSSLDSRKFLFLDLACFLNGLGHMTVILDSSDFGHVGIPTNKSLVIFEFLALSGALNPDA